MPRTELFGTEGDFRCSRCAQRSREKYVGTQSFRAQRTAPLTFLLIVGAVAVFALDHTLLAPPPAAGPNFPGGASLFLTDYREYIWDGQIWRFLTTVLPHAPSLQAGIPHLVFNLYWILIFGRTIETSIGSIRYLGLVLVTAVCPMALQFLSSPGPSVGLSGVVYGFFGYLFALRRHRDYAATHMPAQVAQLFIFAFFLCVFLTYQGYLPVANVAHGAGAVVGWLVGKAALWPWRFLWQILIGLACLSTAFLPLHMPWDKHFRAYVERRAAQLESPKAQGESGGSRQAGEEPGAIERRPASGDGGR